MKQAWTLADKQLKAILAHCSNRRHAARDRAIIATSFYAELRAKEIATLMRGTIVNLTGCLAYSKLNKLTTSTHNVVLKRHFIMGWLT